MLSRRGSTRNNKLGIENLNDVATLVYCSAEKDYRAAIWSRAGWPNFNYFTLDMEYISRTGWRRPAQLSSGPDDPPGEWRTTLDIQAHRDRGRMPTARRQTLEERSFGDLLVRVKGLRIELNRECLDLRCVKSVCLADKALSDMKIVKI